MKEEGKKLDVKKSDLRKRAEARLAALDEPFPELSEYDARELIHELHTYQVELEIQNEELLESEIKFKTLFTNSPDPTWIVDENNVFILCNDAAFKILGYESIEALLSRHPSEVSPEFQPDGQSSLNKANEMMACARREGIHRFEWEHRRSNGTCFPVEVTLSSIKIKGKNCLYCTWRDISERKTIEKKLQNLNQKLELLSLHDGLTDIANRRMFDSRQLLEWGRSMREKQPLSLIMIDIDYFKQYNDTYGHLPGDECLIMVAKALSEVSKRAMDLCARYGGEEFALLLPNTNLMQAINLAEECREKIYQLKIPHKSSSVCDVVTISAGVASITPDKDVPIPSLAKAADEALYLAKHQGRNTVKAI
ncbi:MAG: diguanylate cyclase [Mariprofundaceae bacterium]|nr:diguanylate cyclase [Mariprofundaceae bacterium]